MRSSNSKMFAALFLLLVATMLALTLSHTWDVSMETVLRTTMFGGLCFWLAGGAQAKNTTVAKSKPRISA